MIPEPLSLHIAAMWLFNGHDDIKYEWFIVNLTNCVLRENFNNQNDWRTDGFMFSLVNVFKINNRRKTKNPTFIEYQKENKKRNWIDKLSHENSKSLEVSSK